MLITKYSLTSFNNLVVVPDRCRFLGLGVDELSTGRERVYAKVGIFQSHATWAGTRARFSSGTMPLSPTELASNFKTVRIVLVPDVESTMDYHTILEHNELRNVLLSLGPIVLKSSTKKKKYDGYAIVPITEEESAGAINATTRSRAGGVINETTLTRQIL